MKLTLEINDAILQIGGGKPSQRLSDDDVTDLLASDPLPEDRVDALFASICREYAESRLAGNDVESFPISISDEPVGSLLASFLWRQQVHCAAFTRESTAQERRRVGLGRLLILLLKATAAKNQVAYRPEIALATSALRSYRWIIESLSWLRFDSNELTEIMHQSMTIETQRFHEKHLQHASTLKMPLTAVPMHEWYMHLAGGIIPQFGLQKWNVVVRDHWQDRPVNQSALCQTLFPLSMPEIVDAYVIAYEFHRAPYRPPEPFWGLRPRRLESVLRLGVRDVAHAFVNDFCLQKTGEIYRILERHDDFSFSEVPFRGEEPENSEELLPMVRRNMEMWLKFNRASLDEQKKERVCCSAMDSVLAIRARPFYLVLNRIEPGDNVCDV